MFIKIMVCIVVIVICVYIITERQNKKLDAQIAARKVAQEEPEGKVYTIEDNVFSPDGQIEELEGEHMLWKFVGFETEPDNEFDKHAVKVIYTDDAGKDYCIGYLFRGLLQDLVNQYAEEGRDRDVGALISRVYDGQNPKVLYRIMVHFKHNGEI